MWAAGITLYMIIFGGVNPFIDEEKNWMDFDWFGKEPVKVDVKKLSKGELDFGMAERVLGIGYWYQANTDQARTFCRRLVEPVLSRRCSAEKALQDPWICRHAVPHAIAYPRNTSVLQQPEEQHLAWRREKQRQEPWIGSLLGCLHPQMSYCKEIQEIPNVLPGDPNEDVPNENENILYRKMPAPIDSKVSRRLAPGVNLGVYGQFQQKFLSSHDGTHSL
jgi:hypothetical protein